MARIIARRIRTPTILGPSRPPPSQWPIVLAGIILAVLLALSLLRIDSTDHRRRATSDDRQADQLGRIGALSAERDALNILAARLRLDARIDRQALELAHRQVATMQHNQDSLRRRVAQLRDLLGGTRGPIRIDDLDIEALGQRRFRYRLTLGQPEIDPQPIAISLRLRLRGHGGGRQRYLDLVDINIAGLARHELTLTKVERVSGILELPLDFEADSLILILVPADPGLRGLQQEVPWPNADGDAPGGG